MERLEWNGFFLLQRAKFHQTESVFYFRNLKKRSDFGVFSTGKNEELIEIISFLYLVFSL
jgi:hypothetical protein